MVDEAGIAGELLDHLLTRSACAPTTIMFVSGFRSRVVLEEVDFAYSSASRKLYAKAFSQRRSPGLTILVNSPLPLGLADLTSIGRLYVHDSGQVGAYLQSRRRVP
jgi:hypothetical protein